MTINDRTDFRAGIRRDMHCFNDDIALPGNDTFSVVFVNGFASASSVVVTWMMLVLVALVTPALDRDAVRPSVSVRRSGNCQNGGKRQNGDQNC
jgi:hypothetical protein